MAQKKILHPSSCSKFKGLLLFLLLILFSNTLGQAATQVTLTWSPNQEPDLAGYKIHYGLQSRDYTSSIDVGNQTSYTLTGLAEGQTYYFAATAYDSAGNQSDYSAEVAWSSPAAEEPPQSATQVTLAWEPNQEPDLAGYKIHYGLQSRDYTSSIDVGNQTSYTLTGLAEGQTYYFAATAYDTAGIQSDYSAEVAWTSPTAGEPPINEPPVAINDTASTNEKAPVTINVLANDTDADNDVLSISSVASASNGSTTVSGTSVVYMPALNFNGTDSFNYQISDGKGGTASGSVTVHVAAVNDPPVAVNDTASTNEDTPVTINVLANDSDPDNDVLSIFSVGSASNGSTTVSGTSVVYTPAQDFSGTDSFNYQVSDGQGGTDSGSVTIQVAAANDPPVAVNDTASTNENAPVTINVLANDSDPDNDVLSISSVASATNGSTTVSGASVVYTPAQNFNGTDSFNYQVSDGQGGTDSGSVTVEVAATNDPPVASDGRLVCIQGEDTVGIVRATDPEGDNLSYELVSAASQGNVQLNGSTGEYTYTPYADATGSDTFTFKANDGTTDSNQATVTISIIQPEEIITRELGSAVNTDYPDTLKDTFCSIDDIVKEGSETLSTRSLTNITPHKADTIVIRVDMSVIPQSADITDAILYLYQVGSYGEETYTNSVHRIINKNTVIAEVTGYKASAEEPWSPVPEGITHEDIPLGLGDIEEAEDAVALDTGVGYRAWSVKEMVQEWAIDPASNKGLLVMGSDGQSAETSRHFAATENPDPTLRPKLIISYSPGVVPGNNPPIPEIVATVTEEGAPLVNFDGSSSSDSDGSIIDYEWDFGDGEQAFGVLVDHTFPAPAEYTVTLTVMDDGGASAQIDMIITVMDTSSADNEPPLAAINASILSGEAPLQISFDGYDSSDPDGVITDYFWEFGDGETASGESVDHIYLAPGLYSVTLTVTDNEGATGQITTTITVTETLAENVPPTAAISVNVLSGQAPLNVNFDGGSSSDPDGTIIDYTWNFGDGGEAFDYSADYIFTVPGTYVVTLTVMDDQGATALAEITITVSDEFAEAVDFDFNFQPAYTPVPSGYIADYGYIFDEAEGFGWYQEIKSSRLVEHNSRLSPDTAYDTTIYVTPDSVWEVDVPDGNYQVTVCVGDPSAPRGLHNLQVENVPIVDNVRLGKKKPWIQRKINVDVFDGRLTLTFTGSKTPAKLCWLKIRSGNF